MHRAHGLDGIREPSGMRERSGMRGPGMWVRSAACAVDAACAAAALGIDLLVAFVTGGFRPVAATIWLAMQCLWCSTRGRTAGKRAMRIAVVDRDTGLPLGVGRALWRSVLAGVPGLVLTNLGDPERRGWHERAAGSLTVAERSGHLPAWRRDTARTRAESLAAARRSKVHDLSSSRPRALTPSDAAPTGDSDCWAQSASAAGTPAAAGRPDAPGVVAADRHDRIDHVALMEQTTQSVTQAHGTHLPGADATTRHETERAEWELISDDGDRFPIAATTVLGRKPGRATTDGHQTNLAVPHASISKTHALVRCSRDAVSLTDLGSTNGTRVLSIDGLRQQCRGDYPIKVGHGDVVELGDFRLRLRRITKEQVNADQ